MLHGFIRSVVLSLFFMSSTPGKKRKVIVATVNLSSGTKKKRKENADF